MPTTSIPRSEAVITRRWAPDPQGLLELWEHEAPRTLRIVGVFADRDLPYRPREGSRSVAELVGHLADSYRLTMDWLTSTSARTRIPVAAPTGVGEAVQLVARAQADLFHTLSRVSQAAFADVVMPFGTPEPRSVMALGMLKHELHHRGEMYALARVCGHRPPGLYDAIDGSGGVGGI